MKLTIKEDPTVDDIEVSILCPCVDHRVRRIIEAAQAADKKIASISEGFLCIVDIDDVLYAETVDGATLTPCVYSVSELQPSLHL